MFEQILLSLGGTAILVGGAAWLTRSIVVHFLSKDFETFKKQLETQSAETTARLTHSLQLVAAEHETRTSILLERRAKVIAKLYRLLVEFLAAAESFAAIASFAGEPTKPEKAKILHEKAIEFQKFFFPNRIYFNEVTCKNVDELVRGVWKSTSNLRIWWELNEQQSAAGVRMMEAWQETSNFITEKVTPLMSGVEREFRQMLGVGSAVNRSKIEPETLQNPDALSTGGESL